MTREEEVKKQADIYTYNRNNYVEWSDGWTDYNDTKFVEKAFIEGAKWADNNPNWISVEDDLPCNHEELIDKNFKGNFQKTLFVVVWYDNHEDLDCMISENGEWRWLSKFRNSYTHWMPVPQLPQK